MHDVGKGEKGDVPHRVGSVIEGVPYTFQGLNEDDRNLILECCTFYVSRKRNKGAGAFHSAGQSKEGYVGFGTSQHPIFMKLLPNQLRH